ncbi:phosphatase PAP2 family protein [Hansschlegelia plantiphila]|uniref:Phosphatase PAP2 family protein n=1 Tax=Hansschlegelia plantiphila TaxID=374655 RepID=A0A9W6J2E1_9HYPH|nr:phosphatase PAP2 family protein [Hansschlegelia plantiphila]GLK68039.1 phosphatase PAP2 family protein [Hansschlegelia plantiphila]
MTLNSKPLFSVARWTPSWRLPEFGTLIAFLACSALGFAFLRIAEEMAEGDVRGFDEAILLAFRNPLDTARPIGPSWLEGSMIDITSLGGVTVLTMIATLVVAYLVVTARYANAALVTASVVGGAILTRAMKFSFARPRPELVDHLVPVSSMSFPSGHAMTSAITYLTLGALLARTEKRFRVRALIFSVAVLLTLAIGVSRVYLGVHYPTDVLAGWSLGGAWALLCWTVARVLRPADNAVNSG